MAGSAPLGVELPLWSVTPFVGVLLSIALFPLIAPRLWHRHYPKVAAAWGVVCVVPLVGVYGARGAHEVLHVALADYVPFVVLLFGLYTVTGGIALRGRLPGTPGFNTAFLAVGTMLASWIGTTGAAMLLIRPLLRANERRRFRVHVVVFFIFLVANVGGCLTPLGDPPLFLGFLRGVPFFWTMHLVPHLALLSGLLLAAFWVVDTVCHRREDRLGVAGAEPGRTHSRIRIEGLGNLALLAGVVAAVLASGMFDWGEVTIAGVALDVAGLTRDAVLIVLAGVSLAATPRLIRIENGFSWEPMREVAILFAAIFATIVPPLAILKAGAGGAAAPLLSAVDEPAHFFWATGLLSSFLDNAPTYLALLNTGLGRFQPGLPEGDALTRLIADHGAILSAVSAGAVFMGANTYIGNAPNFMVKAIAEESGVEMPSFFGYIVRWTIPFLMPAFALVTWVFFR